MTSDTAAAVLAAHGTNTGSTMLIRAGQKAGRVRTRSWASPAAIIQQRGLSASSGGAFHFVLSIARFVLEFNTAVDARLKELALLGEPCTLHLDVHVSL